jgi:uncharacterized protein (TIGR03435 family)
MPDVADITLLREYADRNSERAFAEIVQRHINLVFSVALRYVGDSSDAQDVTQAVFIILAQKAASLRQRTALTGWLYETTRFTAMNFLTRKTRRLAREQKAYMESTLNDSHSENVWGQLAPLLEEAMTRLSEKERTLVALRFFENKSAAETAALLGIQEWTAHKRASRAMEKLRKFFIKRGVASTTATLTRAISANSIQAAPAVLAKTVTAAAIAKGATASGSTLTLIKGALKVMAWTKAKTAIVAGVGVLLAVGTTTLTVNKIAAWHAHRDSWRGMGLNSAIVDQTAPQVRILPTIFPGGNSKLAENNAATKWGGLNVPVFTIAFVAYEWSPARIVFDTPAPQDKYDFISSLPQESYQGLQRELRNTLGFAGRQETREVDVLLLKEKNRNAPGLKPPIVGSQNDYSEPGHYVADDRALSNDSPPYLGLTRFLEQAFAIPVIDETGLTQHFSIDLRWKPQRTQADALKAVKQAMLDQLGLELVPGRKPVEMLVMEKVK